jgi:hypothetical protein
METQPDTYRTVFDLISDPGRIHPPYGFYALFIVAGLIMLAIGTAQRRNRRKGGRLNTGFAIFWLAFSSLMFFLDARDTFAIRKQARSGEYKTVAGCLSDFHPGSASASRSRTGDEHWSIGTERFDYGVGWIQPGYRQVEPKGGFVHAASRLRVSYVTRQYYPRNEILRLEVIDHGCPAAPDLQSAP